MIDYIARAREAAREWRERQRVDLSSHPSLLSRAREREETTEREAEKHGGATKATKATKGVEEKSKNLSLLSLLSSRDEDLAVPAPPAPAANAFCRSVATKGDESPADILHVEILHARAATFRAQIKDWVASGRVGVPVLGLPYAELAPGQCISCATPLPPGWHWRCPTCLAAVEMALRWYEGGRGVTGRRPPDRRHGPRSIRPPTHPPEPTA